MANTRAEPPNIVRLLRDRELGRRVKISEFELPNGVERRIDEVHNDIVSATNQLRLAVDAGLWPEVEYAVGNFISKMLDSSANPEQVFSITPKKRQERELFASLGGVHLLLRLFAKPFSEPDARSISPLFITRRTEAWNEVLVILREVTFAVPTLSEQVFGNDHLIFLFTLLTHSSVFENTMNLLEEVLAVRIDTFSLALIPDLYGLLAKFTTRQLAHFCRVLSLVLFEPEDRQIMEGSQVLRSCELLQLRRDRMAKASNVVERNQCLIIEMPNMLSRLVLMLRVVNYGPSLADLIRHNVVIQGGLTSELFQLLSTTAGTSEWEHISYLDTIVRNAELDAERAAQSSSYTSSTSTTSSSTASAPAAAPETPSAGHTSGSERTPSISSSSAPGSVGGSVGGSAAATATPAARSPRSPAAAAAAADSEEADANMVELLAAFSATPSTATGGIDMNSLVNVVQIAQNLGVASVGGINHDGESWLMAAMQMHAVMTAAGGGGAGGGGGNNSPANNPPPPLFGRSRGRDAAAAGHSRSSGRTTDPSDAKKQLQFHSMLLAPHQVELLFVFCTLLSGRRKIDVQQRLGSLGLADVLLRMYSRLSWDSPPFLGQNPLEHIHGPTCDCNPENALRVQYLRLAHNFYDRDFLGNPNKKLILTPAEASFIGRCSNPEQASKEVMFLTGKDRGLISRIITTLIKEPPESIYRFWLSSCLEAFLRGSGPEEQLFVSLSGVLSHTVSHIVDMGVRPSVNLQTSFDLLGELVKGNAYNVSMLEAALADNRFRVFMEIVMSNLVDSNVFLRSLFLSMEVFSDRVLAERQRQLLTDSEEQEQAIVPDRLASAPQTPSTPQLLKKEAVSDAYKLAAVPDDFVSYLTHTWVQFSPKPRSEKAIEMLRVHQAKVLAAANSASTSASRHRTDARRMRGSAAPVSQGMRYFNLSVINPGGGQANSNNSSNSSGNSTSGAGTGDSSSGITLTNSISSIGNNVRGAIRNIREVASHFLLGGGGGGGGRGGGGGGGGSRPRSSSSSGYTSVEAASESVGGAPPPPPPPSTPPRSKSQSLSTLLHAASGAPGAATGGAGGGGGVTFSDSSNHGSSSHGRGNIPNGAEDSSVAGPPNDLSRSHSNSNSTPSGTALSVNSNSFSFNFFGTPHQSPQQQLQPQQAITSNNNISSDNSTMGLPSPLFTESSSCPTSPTREPQQQQQQSSSSSSLLLSPPPPPAPLAASGSVSSAASSGASAVGYHSKSGTGAATPDFDDFKTPPEMPMYSSSKKSRALGLGLGLAATGDKSPTKTATATTPASKSNKPSSSSKDTLSPGQQSQTAGWTVPDSMFRLYMFLIQEKEYILLKLMSTVTIHTVNHENICCLNTALLILVLADKRGQLAPTLRRLKRVAEDVIARGAFTSGSGEGPVPPSSSSSSSTSSTAAAYVDTYGGDREKGEENEVATEDGVYTAREEKEEKGEDEGHKVDAGTVAIDEQQDSDDDDDFVLCSICASLEKGALTLSGDNNNTTSTEIAGGILSESEPGSITTDSSTVIASVTPEAPAAAPPVTTNSEQCVVSSCPKCSVRGSRRGIHNRTTGTIISASMPLKDAAATTGGSDRNSNRNSLPAAGGAGGVRSRSSAENQHSSTATTASAPGNSSNSDDTPDSNAHRVLANNDSKSHRVLANFRELLWYWQEYYMRRGRDRLSIEFSSHIPFETWNDLVDKLCRDDGAPTSLLSSPIPLPRSPYSRLSRVHNSSSTEFIHFVV